MEIKEPAYCEYLPDIYATWFNNDDEELEDEHLADPDECDSASCSICGYTMITGEIGWFNEIKEKHGNRLIPRFNYCPNCGSRVVVSKDE